MLDSLVCLTVATAFLRSAAVIPGPVLLCLTIPVLDVRVELAAAVETSLSSHGVLSSLTHRVVREGPAVLTGVPGELVDGVVPVIDQVGVEVSAVAVREDAVVPPVGVEDREGVTLISAGSPVVVTLPGALLGVPHTAGLHHGPGVEGGVVPVLPVAAQPVHDDEILVTSTATTRAVPALSRVSRPLKHVPVPVLVQVPVGEVPEVSVRELAVVVVVVLVGVRGPANFEREGSADDLCFSQANIFTLGSGPGGSDCPRQPV